MDLCNRLAQQVYSSHGRFLETIAGTWQVASPQRAMEGIQEALTICTNYPEYKLDPLHFLDNPNETIRAKNTSGLQAARPTTGLQDLFPTEVYTPHQTALSNVAWNEPTSISMFPQAAVNLNDHDDWSSASGDTGHASWTSHGSSKRGRVESDSDLEGDSPSIQGVTDQLRNVDTSSLTSSSKRQKKSKDSDIASSKMDVATTQQAEDSSLTILIEEHHIVLGVHHTPTRGTEIYRSVRLNYIGRGTRIDKDVVAIMKRDLQQHLAVEFPLVQGPPVFWFNSKKSKTRGPPMMQGDERGVLGGPYGKYCFRKATDNAIIKSMKDARPTKLQSKDVKLPPLAPSLFQVEGPSIHQAGEQALEIGDTWRGDQLEKGLYMKGFREGVQRLTTWWQTTHDSIASSRQRAQEDPDMKSSHLRDAQVQEVYAADLNRFLVDVINRLGNNMVERYDREQQEMQSRRQKPNSSSQQQSNHSDAHRPPSPVMSNNQRADHVTNASLPDNGEVKASGGSLKSNVNAHTTLHHNVYHPPSADTGGIAVKLEDGDVAHANIQSQPTGMGGVDADMLVGDVQGIAGGDVNEIDPIDIGVAKNDDVIDDSQNATL
jgi:hypothetical protein